MRDHVSFVPGWKLLLALALPLLLGVGVVAGAYLYSSAAVKPQPVQAAAAPANLEMPAPAGLLVHVVGAVEHPGLYRMKRGDRVYDAIAAAGGVSVEADITRLPNLAGRLKDGEQVKVAFAKGSSGGIVVTRVNLNTATLTELDTLPGVGPALAQRILDYRAQHGSFGSVDDLRHVAGIGDAKFAELKDLVTV